MDWTLPLALVLGGLFVIVAAIKNWDFFFEGRKVRKVVQWMGRDRARVFYVGLGSFCLLLGLGFSSGLIPMNSGARPRKGEPAPSGQRVTLWGAQCLPGRTETAFTCRYRWDKGKPSEKEKYYVVVEAPGMKLESLYTVREYRDRGSFLVAMPGARSASRVPDFRMYLERRPDDGSGRETISNWAMCGNAAARFETPQFKTPAPESGFDPGRPVDNLDEAIGYLQSTNTFDVHRGASLLASLPVNEGRRKEVEALLLKLFETGEDRVRPKVVEALGVWGSEVSRPVILKAASDSNASVRHEAFRVLAKLGGPEAAKVVVAQLTKDQGPVVAALTSMGPAAEGPVAERLSSNDPKERELALELLRNIGTEKCVPALIEALKHPDRNTRHRALDILGGRKDPRSVEPIAAMLAVEEDRLAATKYLVGLGSIAEEAVAKRLADPNPATQREALRVLANIGTEKSVPALGEALRSSDRQMRHETLVLMAMKFREPGTIVPVARLLLNEEDRGEAVEYLRQMGPAAEETILKGLKHRDPEVVKSCCYILQVVGTRKSLAPLAPVVRSKDSSVSSAAANAVESIARREKAQ